MSYRALKVSPVLLSKALHMPAGSEVIGAEWSFRERLVMLYVQHPSFPVEQEGIRCEDTQLIITETFNENGITTSYSGEFT